MNRLTLMNLIALLVYGQRGGKGCRVGGIFEVTVISTIVISSVQNQTHLPKHSVQVNQALLLFEYTLYMLLCMYMYYI